MIPKWLQLVKNNTVRQGDYFVSEPTRLPNSPKDLVTIKGKWFKGVPLEIMYHDWTKLPGIRYKIVNEIYDPFIGKKPAKRHVVFLLQWFKS